jgi:hypothetical protein
MATATANSSSSNSSTASNSTGKSSGASPAAAAPTVERVILGQEHTPEQCLQFLRKGQTTEDTLMEHLKATVYPLSSLSVLLQLSQTAYVEVMEAQSVLSAKAQAAAKGAKGGKGGGQKTLCPVSLEEFQAGAKEVELSIGKVLLAADVKEFSTGSFGWYFNGKIKLKVGEVTVDVQVGLNMTVIGSKELAAAKGKVA